MCLVLESARSDPFIYYKCLNTLDQGKCRDALFSLRSIYWLNHDEITVLSSISSIIITYLCPN
jgi:hypothetical protein